MASGGVQMSRSAAIRWAKWYSMWWSAVCRHAGLTDAVGVSIAVVAKLVDPVNRVVGI